MSILQRIKEEKEGEVERLLPRREDLKAAARSAGPVRGFREALASSSHLPSLIAEVKKASPSRGLIRPDFDPAEIARSYRRAGADCLSVLTDEAFFKGSLEFLPICREKSGLPCLRKDFLIHPVQVDEARAAGADAVLLILALLEDGQVEELGGIARELGMDVLVEVHDEQEAERVPAWADLVGVNNRSLHTFEEDLETTARLSALLDQPGRLFVSESSLSSVRDVALAVKHGARSVLIGSAFCSAPNIEVKVREVMGW